MREPLEGLDATAEAETAMNEVDPEASVAATSSPDFDRMRRALRDLEAAKARVERDAQRAADEMREKLVVDLLPVLDNLDRTIGAAEQAGESRAMLDGVRLVRSQFANVLRKFGVERIDAKGSRFDPRIHDAISVVPVSHPSVNDTIVDQLQAGYRFGDRLLRPAKVIVGRHQPRWH
jgi:molecular chaperone GrpE (heat shock protein)